MVRARRALPDVDASSYPAASVPRGDSAGLVAVRSGEKRSGAKLDPAAAEDVPHCGVAPMGNHVTVRSISCLPCNDGVRLGPAGTSPQASF